MITKSMDAQEATLPPQPSPAAAPLPIRVFLASPGDVTDERALALKVLERLSYDPFLRGRILVETVAWDKPGADTPMLATMTPQEAITLQRPKPSECDIVIVIFWSRMGTPLPPEHVKPDGSAYLSGTEWEYLDALQGARQMGRPRVLVYRRTEVPSISLDDPQFQEKQDQWQLVKTFFASFRNPDRSIRGGVNDYDTPDAFEKKLTEHLREIFQALLMEHEAKTQVSEAETRPEAAQAPEGPQEPPLWEGSPFPGLRAFGEDDAPLYFGRGRETDGLIRRLDEGARFITVVGASGSGKSSLVAAGLLPRLKNNAVSGSRDWLRVRVTPGELGENPFIALVSGFKPVLDRHARRVRDEAKKLETDPSALGELIGLMLEDQREWSELLLFVDQFEELFTVVGAGYRGAFSELLAYAATLPRLRTVTTLRADFYHRCVEQLALAELLRAGSYPLAAPGVGALHEMITRPVARAGLSFEAELPERILDDTGAEPGALPLMAFALSELYENRTDDRQLTHAAYEKFEGVKGAISQRAEDIFQALDDDAKAMFASVFRELVEVESTENGWVATRRRTSLTEVAPTLGAQQLVAAFTKARLLLQSGGEENAMVEVAHEALLRNWPRLVEWIQKTGEDLAFLRQLRRAAIDWRAQARRGDLLWPRRRRKQAKEMLDRLQVDLGDPEQPFLNASRWRWRKRVAGISAGVMILGAFVASFVLASFGFASLDLQVAWARAKLEWVPVPKMVEICGPAPTAKCTDGQTFTFLMGSPKDERGASENERPQHPVTFTRGFRIGVKEVTFAEYDVYALMNALPLPFDNGWGRGNRPVIDVSWEDAKAYVEWLSKEIETGKHYRLPTEAEWEYAARANTTTPYWWGNEIQQDGKIWANCDGCGSYWNSQTAPVSSFAANPFGLYDMAGNVWEWVEDCWHDSYEGAPKDGSTWISGGECVSRVLRGGSWSDFPHGVRSATRSWFFRVVRFDSSGFRVAQDL